MEFSNNKYKEILLRFENGILTIKFNRPHKKNAMSSLMYREVTQALSEAAKNDKVIITVLTGEGDYYSSGNDLTDTMQAAMEDDLERKLKEGSDVVRNYIKAYIDFPKVLVAAVNGPAIGIAVTTLPLCDVVYASDKATFLTPFTNLGLVAEGCSSYTFPKIMGYGAATELLSFNKKIDAYQAKQCRLVTEVFPDNELNKKVWSLLAEYRKFSQKSLLINKYLMRYQDRDILHKVCDMEMDKVDEQRNSPEMLEALVSFVRRTRNSKRSKL